MTVVFNPLLACYILGTRLHLLRVGRNHDVYHSVLTVNCPQLYWAQYIFLETRMFVMICDK